MLCRRKVLGGASAALASYLTPLAGSGVAQTIARPARMLVGFPAGSGPDAVARLVAEHMQGYAPSMIVENRAGAGGRIALEALKTSEPDGSVMVLTPVDQLALFPHVYNRLSYHPTEDFAPVATVCTLQFMLAISPKVPPNVSSLKEFIAWCRANPAEATYGSPGAGTHPHFIGFKLARAAGFDFVHAPYKGAPPLVQDMLGGHLTAGIVPIGSLLPHVQAGAYAASPRPRPVVARRSPMYPLSRSSITSRWKVSNGSAFSFRRSLTNALLIQHEPARAAGVPQCGHAAGHWVVSLSVSSYQI